MKQVEPKVRFWHLVLAIAGVLLAALLLSGATNPQPRFEARSTLKPLLPEKPVEPIVIRKVVRVQTLPSDAPEPSESLTKASGGQGYILPGFNCVACVQALTGRAQSGMAGSHTPSFSTPKVGAIMIWYAGEQGAGALGHVGVVQGINPDGTVNIAHCNWGGGQTTFASTGKFY